MEKAWKKDNKFGVKVEQSKLKNGENLEEKRENAMMPAPRELI